MYRGKIEVTLFVGDEVECAKTLGPRFFRFSLTLHVFTNKRWKLVTKNILRVSRDSFRTHGVDINCQKSRLGVHPCVLTLPTEIHHFTALGRMRELSKKAALHMDLETNGSLKSKSHYMILKCSIYGCVITASRNQ